MNYQKLPEYVISILEQHKKDIPVMDYSYFAWPQVFPSTSGPSNRIGGSSMSNFTIEAYVINNQGPTIYVCSGYYMIKDEPFEPLKHIKGRWQKINFPASST